MTGISINVISQKINCKLIHEGLFKLNTEYSGTTIIKRIRNIQIEENLILGFKMSYYVTWINDCTYELRPKKLIKGNVKFAGNLDDVFTVQIISLKTKSYVSKTSTNFSNEVLEREILILE